MSKSHDDKTILSKHEAINWASIIKKTHTAKAADFFNQFYRLLIMEGIVLNSVYKKSADEKAISTILNQHYLPRLKQLLTKQHRQFANFCKQNVRINSLISALAEQSLHLITLNIMKIDLDSLIDKMIQHAIKNKEVKPLIRLFNDYHTKSLALFPTNKETLWSKLATDTKKHISSNENIGGGYLTNQEIAKLAVMPIISLVWSWYIIKSSNNETASTVMTWLTNIKFLCFVVLLGVYLIVGRNFNTQKKLAAPITVDPEMILTNTCSQYIRSNHHHSATEYALLGLLGAPKQATTLLQSSGTAAEELPSNKPLKRWQTASENISNHPASATLVDSKMQERRIIEDEKNHVLYYEFKRDIFCKHDASEMQKWGKRLGHGDGVSFEKAIKETYKKNNFFRPAGSTGPGINLVASGEKKNFKFDLKLKLNHSFNHLRIGANKRLPNIHEKEILGQDSEIYSPKGTRNK
ncbi:hypothetical protein AYO45_03195 [Gammaproteobacteria bacterium SCGC AG-212-F23]|nr:hypothetical protein AYO45_03195 [Gammaproteobacteria bacterium SCGC AG-212-F23]